MKTTTKNIQFATISISISEIMDNVLTNFKDVISTDGNLSVLRSHVEMFNNITHSVASEERDAMTEMFRIGNTMIMLGNITEDLEKYGKNFEIEILDYTGSVLFVIKSSEVTW